MTLELEIVLRTAVPGDAEAIASLLASAFEEFRNLYTQKGFEATAVTPAQVLSRMREGPSWVAVSREEIVGAVSVVRKDNAVYVRGMAVHPNARGRGIGERLLKLAEAHAEDEGLQRLFLNTTPFLDNAIRLYERCGFRRVNGSASDLFGTPLFTMEKFLTR